MPTTTDHDCKTVLRRVTTYGRKPRSATQALIQAHELLSEEGRWVKGDLVKVIDSEKLYEDPSCGSWACCAAGGIQMVTGDVEIKICKVTYRSFTWWTDQHDDELIDIGDVDYEVETDLEDDILFSDAASKQVYGRAMMYLAAAIENTNPTNLWEKHARNRGFYGSQSMRAEDLYEKVFNFNDADIRRRSDVLKKFEKAIALSKTERIPSWIQF